MKVLLDTNAYTALRQGQEVVAEQVRSSEEVLLSIVVVGELLFGFRPSDVVRLAKPDNRV